MIDGTNEYRVAISMDGGHRSFQQIRAYTAAEAVRSVRRSYLVPIRILAVWILRQRWEALGDAAWDEEG